MVDLHNPNVVGTLTGVDFATSNKISQGNSDVTVLDTGTGLITMTVDGTEVLKMDGSTPDYRFGTSAYYFLVDIDSSEVAARANSLKILSMEGAAQRLGQAANTRIELRQVPDGSPGIDMYASTTQVFGATPSTIFIGDSLNDFLEVNNGSYIRAEGAGGGTCAHELNFGSSTNQTFSVTLHSDVVMFFDGDGTGNQETDLRFGFSGGNRLDISESADVALTSTGALSLTSANGTTVNSDLTVTGDLFVDGTTFVVNNEEVTTSDNIIVVNNGETGPGVTAGSAGIQVDRGSATNYQFLFVEATDTFRIGEIGSLQAVATREDSPTDQRFPLWNDSSKRFDTATSTITRIATGIQATVAAFDIKSSGGEDAITINNNGAVELFHNNVNVMYTNTLGITVDNTVDNADNTGTFGFRFAGSSTLQIANLRNGGGVSLYGQNNSDVEKAIFTGDPDGGSYMYATGVKVVEASSPGETWLWSVSASGYARLRHDNTNFEIKNTTDGGLLTLATELATNVEKIGIVLDPAGGVDLYYNDIKVAETTANGISGAVWG